MIRHPFGDGVCPKNGGFSFLKMNTAIDISLLRFIKQQ